MIGGREHLRQMRRRVHSTWSVRALYVARTGAVPVRVDVRLHVKFDESGSQGSDPINLADKTPRVKFARSAIPTPARGAVVLISEAEGYLIDHSRPPDDEWIVAEVTQLSEAKANAAWQPGYEDLLA